MIEVEANVLFAAPHHLHRLADFRGENWCLRHISRLRLSAETDTQQCYMADPILFPHAECHVPSFLHRLPILVGRPENSLAILHVSTCRRGLTGGVREHWNVIVRLMHLGCL